MTDGAHRMSNVDVPAALAIRSYDEGDEQAVAALWREVFPDAPPRNEPHANIRRKLAVQRELFFVAVESGAVVGTAMGGYDGHRGWVYGVAVSPGYRRRGIGATLMQRVEDELRRLGCPKLNLQIRSDNREAVAFYEGLGYRIEERISMGKSLAD